MQSLERNQEPTWSCHICGKERPDSKISVLSKPLVAEEPDQGRQNIRYCNDDGMCVEKAKTFSLLDKAEGRLMRDEIRDLSAYIGETLGKHITQIAEQYGVDYEEVARIYDQFAGERQADF